MGRGWLSWDSRSIYTVLVGVSAASLADSSALSLLGISVCAGHHRTSTGTE